MIDIRGLDKASVIQALYAAARPQGMGFLSYSPGGLARDRAEALVGQYLDYLNGRVMKLLIKADVGSFDERGYDRDNGSGAARRVVNALRVGDAASMTSAIHKAGVAAAAAVARDDMGRGTEVARDRDNQMTIVGLHLPDDPKLREAIDKAMP